MVSYDIPMPMFACCVNLPGVLPKRGQAGKVGDIENEEGT